MINVAVINGGRGAAGLITALLKKPNINLTSIVNAYEIAKSSNLLKCFVMGTNDLSAELGLDEDLKRTALVTSFEKCMMASKAFKLSILDGVFNDIGDPSGFEEECIYSHGLGFDGKTLIHLAKFKIVIK